MASASKLGNRRLRGLGNISWLTSRQLDKLAGALTVSIVERPGVLSEEKNSADLAYVLLAGVARITCLNRKRPRNVLLTLAPRMIPRFPPTVVRINYHSPCC